jgi:MFS family permease
MPQRLLKTGNHLQMSDAAPASSARPSGAFAPLREGTFRAVWLTSVLSNFGQLIQGVGAAWEMTRLTTSPGMVALVQTALMLPLMLISIPAGAIADTFDKRKVALTGLSVATLCAAALTVLSFSKLTTPWVLLGFTSLIGAGVALYGPAWQSSIREQVKPEQLPAAVALGSVSYNIARSFGPAVGGVIVLAFGATVAFGVNALFYLPLMAALFLWHRPHVAARLPPERIHRGVISGARYAFHSPPIRIVMIRAIVFGFASASLAALTPLIARELLHGNAGTYGLLLGAGGVGAVIGALLVSAARERLKAETAARLCAIVAGVSILLVALSRHVALTAALLAIAGAAFMLYIALLSIAVQLSAPRWVTARAIACFQSSLTGGVAIGAWLWGAATADWGLVAALIVSGSVLILTPLVGFALPMPRISERDVEMIDIANEPEVGLALTARSGPIVIELDYRVDPNAAREFYDLMLKMQLARLRNGAFDWSISRDIGDPELWTERYHCPTWADYLRLRGRITQSDRDLQNKADAFHQGTRERRVRRRLERPFGSVRWRAETPDPHDTINLFPP